MSYTRKETIRMIAIYLAAKDKYDWQAHPSWQQSKKQDRYTLAATSVVGMCEIALEDYKWKMDKTVIEQ